MSEATTAVPKQAATRGEVKNRVTELKVSGHLMTLETGVFCVFQAPGSPGANANTGLPGVRISPPPGPAGRPEAVQISTFHNDGWLGGSNAAALIRVSQGPAQVLVTVYQAPNAGADSAPRLQVMKLGGETPAEAASAAVASGQPTVPILPAGKADIVAHVQRTGDVASKLGDWVGTRGSRMWIEGFSLTPHDDIKPADVEYQAVLGRGWLSPWIEGGKFCGSRGMSLPLLGLKVRLKGAVGKTHECSYSATFVDGSTVGPVPGGETCEAESLAALEAFQIVVRRRNAAPSRMRAAGAGTDTELSPAAAKAKRPGTAKRAR